MASDDETEDQLRRLQSRLPAELSDTFAYAQTTMAEFKKIKAEAKSAISRSRLRRGAEP